MRKVVVILSLLLAMAIIVIGILVVQLYGGSIMTMLQRQADKVELTTNQNQHEKQVKQGIVEHPEYFACTSDADCTDVSKYGDCNSCCESEKMAINSESVMLWYSEVLKKQSPICMQGCMANSNQAVDPTCHKTAICLRGQCKLK